MHDSLVYNKMRMVNIGPQTTYYKDYQLQVMELSIPLLNRSDTITSNLYCSMLFLQTSS